MRTLRIAAFGLTIATIAGFAGDPLTTKKVLTLDGARQVIAAAKAEAREKHSGGVIAVVDDGGNLMALERIDGTFAAGAKIALGKARPPPLFSPPTKLFQDLITHTPTPHAPLK